MKAIEMIDTGRVSYEKSYELQLNLTEEMNNSPDKAGYLVITEPNPTITKGIRGGAEEIFCSLEELKKRGIEVAEIRRGGKVTFHGPGQLVIYPLLNLIHFKKSIRWYIEALEETVIKTLEELGVGSHKKDGIVGIFGSKGKVCAIGIEVKRWKTLHGIALNHEVDLSYFDTINPCGIQELGVSSISNEGISVSREKVIEVFKEKFSEVFQTEFT